MADKLDLQDVLEYLEDNAPCCFWGCPGVDKPTEDMATCSMCGLIQDLREQVRGDRLKRRN